MNTDQLISFIISEVEANSDSNRAPKMEAYMKNLFVFSGLDATKRKNIISKIKQNYKINTRDQLIEIVLKLWQLEQREYQYIGTDLLVTYRKKMTVANLETIEDLIITKSWWDTVDALAANVIGPILNTDENFKNKWAYKWINSNIMWLNRTAIIFQLKYRNMVNSDLLTTAILTHDSSKEFFIRKAQGWALREYSKVNPIWVRSFIDANPQLSGLTVREGSKYL
jgi:3-methyladenine DNA glycosylase AlkD